MTEASRIPEDAKGAPLHKTGSLEWFQTTQRNEDMNKQVTSLIEDAGLAVYGQEILEMFPRPQESSGQTKKSSPRAPGLIAVALAEGLSTTDPAFTYVAAYTYYTDASKALERLEKRPAASPVYVRRIGEPPEAARVDPMSDRHLLSGRVMMMRNRLAAYAKEHNLTDRLEELVDLAQVTFLPYNVRVRLGYK